MTSEYESGYTDGKRDGWVRGFVACLVTVAAGILIGGVLTW